ncbi:hypothetical protein BGX12_10663 [Fibrobacter sp. UWR4]|nr:hypothetical protein BGX12_10663 [Fibrobacter sp. UWR4]PZW70854.1 hypothetical protein C8E88_101046 [Fibrobacter sp. UWR1]
MLSAAFAADKWENFSSPLPIYNAVPFENGGLMVATGGGVRYRSVSSDYVYHSEHGLESSEIYAIASSDKGYFAVSREGIVSVLNGNALSWRAVNRSYAANKRDVVPGAATMGKDIMTIGFEDRLAFFNAPLSYSVLTINRICDQSLAINKVNKVLADGDTLFVQLDKGAYARKMDWDHMDSDISLVDPDSWIKLPEERVVKGMEPWDSTKVVVDGKTLDDPSLKEHIYVFDDKGLVAGEYDRSMIKQVIPADGGHYLVGPKALFFYDGTTLTDLVDNAFFPLTDTYEVEAFPAGGVYAISTQGEFSFYDGHNWTSEPIAAPVGSGSTGFASRLKNFSYLPDGHVLFHAWGMGYYGYSDWGTRWDYDTNKDRGLCLDPYDGKSSYIISLSIVPAPDSSGFITIAGSFEGYSLAYFSKSGDVVCANHIGKFFNAAPLHSFINDDGRWVVYAATRGEDGLSSTGSLDIITFPSPKSNGGELSRINVKTVTNSSITAPIDMVYEPVQKRLWMVTASSLVYYDEERDTLLTPTSVKGLSGAEYTSIDSDPHGNLWVGTADHGAYMVSLTGKSPDTLKAVNFSARAGMLCNRVSDLSVDPVQGKVWFSHEMGVSSLQRMEARDASKFMTDSAKAVKAYPMPFRPKVHKNFIIDNIAENAVVSIFNRGGSLIRSFSGSEIIGGRMTWDGCGKDGRLVSPGVYYYVVKTSSKAKKGKFIIIH